MVGILFNISPVQVPPEYGEVAENNYMAYDPISGGCKKSKKLDFSQLASPQHYDFLDFEEGSALEDKNSTLLAIRLPGVLLPIHASPVKVQMTNIVLRLI